MASERSNIVPALILGLSLLAGLAYFGNRYYQARLIDRTVTVKGLAEKEVKANLGSWTLRARAEASTFTEINEELGRQTSLIEEFLREQGFEREEFRQSNISIYGTQMNDRSRGYSGEVEYKVHTGKVDLLEEVSGKLSLMIDKGVALSGDSWSTRPQYYFTEINEVKSGLLRDATRAALQSAEEFAKNSNATVGDIQSAHQGVITLKPGNHSDDQHEFYKNKIVRVVTTIRYYIN